MKISNSYLEDEVREGFFVPSIMKRAWATELQVLSEVAKVCQRHGISWYAEWGTLLGAVRHHGFIPWDDDIDILMPRKDYEHFLQVSDELPEGFAVLNLRNRPNFWYFMAKVVAKPQICFEEEHLKEYNGFPYIAGIDLFVGDYVASDPQKEEMRITAAKYVLSVADALGTPKLQKGDLEEHLSRIEMICQVKISLEQEESVLKLQLYQLVEQMFSMFEENESKEITQMMPYEETYQKRRRMPKECYTGSIQVPFEYTSVSLPVGYEYVLEQKYKNYMNPLKCHGGHTYPFFLTQRKQLEEVLEFKIPGFYYSKEGAVRAGLDRTGSLKEKSLSTYEVLKDLCVQIKEKISNVHIEKVLEILVDAQQKAIAWGTYIDSVKGEGLQTVGYLELFCEMLYQIYIALQQKKGHVDSEIEKLGKILLQIQSGMKQEIIDRHEIVFLPYKAKHWETMEILYEKAKAEPDWDVYVIPVPYYDKNYAGDILQRHDESEELAEKVSVTAYHSFDFIAHHPECIVIQNPYDEYNMATTVDEQCYSKNLQRFTECLVYIPYFIVDEFQKEDKAYNIMQYYCNMPGVINADKVYVQSENMRSVYLEKLTEFAGEETKEMWERKIYSIDALKKNELADILEQS